MRISLTSVFGDSYLITHLNRTSRRTHAYAILYLPKARLWHAPLRSLLLRDSKCLLSSLWASVVMSRFTTEEEAGAASSIDGLEESKVYSAHLRVSIGTRSRRRTRTISPRFSTRVLVFLRRHLLVVCSVGMTKIECSILGRVRWDCPEVGRCSTLR